MYIRWTNFKCPFCGATWSSRIVSAPRPDRECRTCTKCNKEFKTHDIEWAHMTTKQRVSYVLNEWMVAWLLFYGLLVFAIMAIGSDQATTLSDYLIEVGVIVAVAAAMFGPILLAKGLLIRRSKQRTLTAKNSTMQTIGAIDNHRV